jgi:hypothetical protein
MQAQETILFLAVAGLATALIVVLVAPWWRELRARDTEHRATPRMRAEDGPQPTPDAATTVNAGEPVAAGTVTAPSSASGMTGPTSPPQALAHMICPTCRRQFAAGVRYCPFDARVLTADLHQAGRLIPSLPSPPAAAMANAGKICPSCARRYDVVALVCGRDGTALVSVN